MGRLIVDAASSLDGYWADVRGRNVFDASELQGAGLSGRVSGRYGAVVMSRRSFESSANSDWIAEAYPAETPIFVVSDQVLAFSGQRQVRVMRAYSEAFRAAQIAAGDGAVLVVGDAGAVEAAMGSGQGAEIWLRMVSRTLGKGTPLFEDGLPVDKYFVSEMDATGDAVHMHLERRVPA